MTTDDDKRAKRKAHSRAYYLAHRAEILARVKEHYAKTRDARLAYAREYAEKNRDLVLAKARAFGAKNRLRPEVKAKRKAQFRERYAAMGEAIREAGRAHHHANRDKRLAQKSAWAKANPHKGAGYATARRAAQLRATPAWAEPFFIEEAYHIAAVRTAATGIAWEVDHRVPLISKSVCGFHVIDNLQVIPRAINRRKLNLQWPDQPGCGA